LPPVVCPEVINQQVVQFRKTPLDRTFAEQHADHLVEVQDTASEVEFGGQRRIRQRGSIVVAWRGNRVTARDGCSLRRLATHATGAGASAGSITYDSQIEICDLKVIL
jgi:hypothetical protein